VKFTPSHASFISKSNSENYIENEIRWFLTKLQTKISSTDRHEIRVMTHFDHVNDGQNFDFSKPRWRTADARARPAVDTVKTTQQGAEPIHCGCRRGACILASAGEYDWTVCVRRRCGLMSNYFDHLFNCRSSVVSVEWVYAHWSSWALAYA